MRRAIIDIVIINVIVIRDMSWEGDFVKINQNPSQLEKGFFMPKLKNGTQ